jgi:transcriptional regulator with XRE-family HTH domain
MAEGASNPAGFSERLRILMDGWGYETTRPLAKASGVSHGTIANWLNGKGRASLDEVEKVARVFDWTATELYLGQPVTPQIMTRVAELDAFRARALRLAAEIAGHGAGHVDSIPENRKKPLRQRANATGRTGT